MRSAAVFLDAGYLYSAGSDLLYGEVLRRRALKLERPEGLIEKLVAAASACCDGESFRLLRTYWYDGAADDHGVPSATQVAVGELPKVKLRLGRMTASGQKGVDGLIILDLITLARNRAVDVAILFTGDEDLREAALHAQGFGLTLVVAGFPPTAGQGQSKLLLREADHVVLLSADELRDHLSAIPDAVPRAASPSSVDEEAAEESIRQVCRDLVTDPRFNVGEPLVEPSSYPPRLTRHADRVLVARLADLTGTFPVDQDLLRHARNICLEEARSAQSERLQPG